MVLLLGTAILPMEAQQRARSRALGIVPGVLPVGPANAITDVPVCWWDIPL